MIYHKIRMFIIKKRYESKNETNGATIILLRMEFSNPMNNNNNINNNNNNTLF